MKSKLLLFSILLSSLFGLAVESAAQTVTVELSQTEYEDQVALNESGGMQVAEVGGVYVAVNNNPYTPPTDPPCVDYWTTTAYNNMLAQANITCQRQWTCVQRADCNFYIIYVDPTNPGCLPYNWEWVSSFDAVLVDE